MRKVFSRFGFLFLTFSLSLLWPRLGNAYDHLVEKKVSRFPRSRQ